METVRFGLSGDVLRHERERSAGFASVYGDLNVRDALFEERERGRNGGDSRVGKPGIR
jgi:hypothetical protein